MQASTMKTGLVFCMCDTIETAFFVARMYQKLVEQVEKIISIK